MPEGLDLPFCGGLREGLLCTNIFWEEVLLAISIDV
jgi:hypothetical protein